MSKPISISFGKAKVKPSALTPTPPGTQSTAIRIPPPKRPAFTADAEDDVEDDGIPAHESVLGFASDGGAILSQPVKATEERVIENRGNADWRMRGRAVKATSQQPPPKDVGSGAATAVEKEEASKKAGLQLAKQSTNNAAAAAIRGDNPGQNGLLSIPTSQPNLDKTAQTADEAALSALLHGDPSSTSSASNIIIESQPQHNQSTTATAVASSPSAADETLSFLADVASRPDPATLSEYAAMPVEEFGMALLRGMGKKRRANGEVIVIKNPNKPDDEAEDEQRKKGLGAEKKMRDPNAGYLGIGAKAVKIGSGSGSGSANGKAGGGAGGEDGLGAWGKADMRRNKKGEGLYTPVMLRDRRTGELISERELEERRSAAKAAVEKTKGGEEDWRERRDRNLHRYAGRPQDLARERNGEHREKTNGSSSSSSSSRTKMIEYRDGESSSRHSASSDRRRRRSRSRERDRDKSREGDRGDKYRDRDRDRSGRDRLRGEEEQQQQRYGSIPSSSSSARRNADRDRYDDNEGGRDSRAGSERRRRGRGNGV